MKRCVVAIGACLVWTASVRATWSIVAVDTKTMEVAVGSATCLTSFDLRALTPVVLVGVGGAAVQSQGDFDGRRRPVIFREFQNGTTSPDILDIVAMVPGHQGRQYGIADTGGGVATFSGSQNGQHASGVTGRVGDILYAIQGNVLTGPPVVLEAERAFVNTPGDLAEKLMAAMEGARRMGGDGRCSCSPNNPTRCGSPPPDFEKSAHIGYMIVARLGDADGDVCDRRGCARGDYFLNFNVPFQTPRDPDPVFQLRDMFDAWRADLLGRTDAMRSTVRIEENGGRFDMNIELVDWRGTPLGHGVQEVTVKHAASSAAATDIGEVIDNGDGTYAVTLTPNGRAGIDRFEVTVNDGDRPVTLLPLPRLRDAACDVLVRRTRAKARNRKLLVIVSLRDGDGNPVPGHNVGLKIGRRIDGPTFEEIGPTTDGGRAKKRFSIFEDDFQAHVISITPPPPGGNCLDPDRPGQRLHSKFVHVKP